MHRNTQLLSLSCFPCVLRNKCSEFYDEMSLWMHKLKCISMKEIAEGNIVLLGFRTILAGSEGIAVSSCINLKEKLCC